MKTLKAILTIQQRASGSGGDKFQGLVEGIEKPYVVYVPQPYSRQEGKQIKSFKIELEPID